MQPQLILQGITTEAFCQLIVDMVFDEIRNQLQAAQPEQTEDAQLLTRAEAAARLRVSIFTLHRRVKEGKIQPVYVGGRVLFQKKDLEELIVGRRDLKPRRAR